MFVDLGLGGRRPEFLPMAEDVFFHAAFVDLTVEPQGKSSESFGLKRSSLTLVHRGNKTFDTLLLEQDAGGEIGNVQHGLKGTSAGKSDNGLAACHGLDRHYPEILFSREDDCFAASIKIPHAAVWQPAGEFYPRPRHFP